MARGWVAGPYLWTFNGRNVGITENGFRLSMTSYGDPIKGDNLGDSIQDFVYRGGDVTVEGTFQEFDAALNGDGQAVKINSNVGSVFWPYASLGDTGQVGRLASSVSAVLTGTAIPGVNPLLKNITITAAVIPPGFDVGFLFAARLRNVPIRLQSLPWPGLVQVGSSNWFTL